MFLQVDVEDELVKLHLRFKESLSVYNMACQDAAAAEQKVINIWTTRKCHKPGSNWTEFGVKTNSIEFERFKTNYD